MRTLKTHLRECTYVCMYFGNYTYGYAQLRICVDLDVNPRICAYIYVHHQSHTYNSHMYFVLCTYTCLRTFTFICVDLIMCT